MSRIRRIHPRAGADMSHIFSWLERRSPRGAAAWYDALFQAIDRIAENPESFSTIPESRPRWQRAFHQALFKTPHGNPYRIVFEVTDTELRILRIRTLGQPPLRRRDLPEI